ncbi:hypothetical protein ACV160_25960, partial [Escherichia coli]
SVRHISKPISYFKIHLLSGISGGQLSDKTLLPVLDTMLYKFDDNEIITSAIDKLKRS